MEYGKTELIEKLINVPAEGWTRQKVKDLIDSLWRNPTLLRWSGFEFAGSPDSVISFDEASRTFTIAPVERAFSYYQYKNKLTYHVHTVAHQVQIVNYPGKHLIYFDFDEETKKQVLLSKYNPSDEDVEKIYLHRVVVAWILWAPAEESGSLLYFGDSRHGSEWPSQVHWWNHITHNSLRESGLAIINTLADRDASSNDHAKLSVTEGAVMHSDILRNCCTNSNWPIWYVADDGIGILSNPGYVFYRVDDRVSYNDNGPIAADNNWFVMYHLFATNCKITPLISAMGLNQYERIGDAYLNMTAEVDTIRNTFPQSNMMYIGSVILQSNDNFQNDVKTRIVTREDHHVEVIEFGFCDAADVSSWDLDISAEYAYTILHAWLRTDTGTLTGVNVKINATPVTGINSCTVTGTKAQFMATGANIVTAGDTVTLNITPGTPEYIGGHLYVQRS
jgi:hypothetical protein